MTDLTPFTDTQITVALIVAIAVLGLLSFAVLLRRRGRIIAKPLMTANEVEFFGRLLRAADATDLVVLAQVSMGALLTHAGVSGSAKWRVRSRFDRLIVDYVACTQDICVVALIELDDRLHSRIKDTRRDTMTRAAGYTTLRYNSWAKPSTGELIQTLEHLRGRKAPARVTVS